MNRTVGIKAEQKTRRSSAARIEVIGTRVNAPLGIGYAVVEYTLPAICFLGQQYRLCLRSP